DEETVTVLPPPCRLDRFLRPRRDAPLDEPEQSLRRFKNRTGEVDAAQFVNRATADECRKRTIGLRERALPSASQHRHARVLEQPVALGAALVELRVQLRKLIRFGL